MKRQHFIALVLSLFYLLLFLPFVGQVHLFDWDEINFAEAAREMLVTGNWLNIQINYEPFWEKPPLFMWLQVLSFKLFGINEMAARIPNVFVGLISLLCLYYFCFRRYGLKTALTAVLLYLGSLSPHFYFKSGIIDPLFNLLILLSLYQLVRSIESNRIKYFFYAGLFLGLSVLAKGPVSVLILGLCGLSYQLIYRHQFYNIKSLLLLLGGLLLFPGLWFGLQVWQNGWWFLQEFIVYQVELFSQPVASHGQPFFYHPLVLLLGCFPLFILAFPALFKTILYPGHRGFVRWMKCLFWVVLILFSMVTTKIIHYNSLCYLPLAVLGALWLNQGVKMSFLQKTVWALVALLWTIALFVLPLIAGSESLQLQLGLMIRDDFALAQLRQSVNWGLFSYVIAFAFAILHIWILWRYSLLNLMSYLLFMILIISVIIMHTVPKVEAHTQKDWIDHLSTYQQKTMLHFTRGFKSYAHVYYTGIMPDKGVDEMKWKVLREKTGKNSFFGLSREEKEAFDIYFREYIIRQTNYPFSLSAKTDQCRELEKDTLFIKVFEGNGYCVFERSKR